MCTWKRERVEMAAVRASGTATRRSSSVEKRTPCMLIFNFRNRSKSGGLMSGLKGGWGSTSQLYLSNNSRTSIQRWGRALSCKIKTPFSSKSGLFACILRLSFSKNWQQKAAVTVVPLGTIVCENHHLFHVRLGPLEFFAVSRKLCLSTHWTEISIQARNPGSRFRQ